MLRATPPNPRRTYDTERGEPVNTRLKKAAVFLHRWMGVTFCLLFAWWFLSGIFMMYWDYLSVTAADRLERGRGLDASGIYLEPQAAYQFGTSGRRMKCA